MIIIKRGNLNKEVKFECRNCGSIFIAERGEWRIPGRLDDEDADYACECPICKRIVYAKENHLQSYNDYETIEDEFKHNKGKWIKDEENIYHCSECGRRVHKDWVEDMEIDYPFCHCGAEMKEVRE